MLPETAIPAIVVRNLSPETHRALRVRAAEQGRSTEAEVRAILDEAPFHRAGIKLINPWEHA